MEKNKRIALMLVLDTLFINLSFLVSLFLLHNGSFPVEVMHHFFRIILILIPMKLYVFSKCGLYSSLWEYASIDELIKVVAATFIGGVVTIIYLIALDIPIFYGVYIVMVLFEITFIGGTRFSYRFFRRLKNHRSVLRQDFDKNVLIIGSGATASMIATEIRNHPDAYGHVVGYIDEDLNKQGKSIAGVRILGTRHDIYSVTKKFSVDEIILAIPTLTKAIVRETLDECKRTGAKVRIVPGIMEIMDGKVSMSKIRDVEIEDLLGRDPVNLNVSEIASYIEDKTVLVTGGGGSIGSELCRQIVRFNPKKLIILDVYENNAYDIQLELLRQYPETLNLEVLIASVRERDNIFEIVRTRKPDVIFHAAAHKHVPLMEHAPKEAIKNNVFGTLNVAEAANEYGVERFVLISTDKAVNPTNVMGASKRMCEMIIQGLAKTSKTKYTAVRFGNVLGSNGSVIPLFKKQIKEGGPVTITHKEIIRYFMTIPEAAQLVIQAGAIASGGEIFVLDMGDPVKIYTLAEDLIRLSGFEPHQDIKIEVTGLRPGEKLFEELLMADENLKHTVHKKIFIGYPTDITFALLKKSFKQLEDGLFSLDNLEYKELVQLLVPTYKIDYQQNERVNEVEDFILSKEKGSK